MTKWFPEILQVLIRQFVKPAEIARAKELTTVVLDVCQRTFNKQYPINLSRLFMLAGIPNINAEANHERLRIRKAKLNEFDYTFRKQCYLYAVNYSGSFEKRVGSYC